MLFGNMLVRIVNFIENRDCSFKRNRSKKPQREVSQSRKLKKIKMAQPAFLSHDDLHAAGILMCETRSLQYCIDVKLHDRPHQYSHSLWKEYLVENYIQHFYWHCVIYDSMIVQIFYTSAICIKRHVFRRYVF